MLILCLAVCWGCAQQASTDPTPNVAVAMRLRQGKGGSKGTAGASESTEAATTGWGTLRGQFTYQGARPTPAPLKVDKDQEICGKVQLVDESVVVGEGNGLANVVIYLRNKNPRVHPDYEALAKATAVLDNKDCRFQPHVMVIQTGQPLQIKNSDSKGHNSKIDALGDTPFNALIPAVGNADYVFKKTQSLPQSVQCTIHGWMKGFVLPRDNPYMAVTDKDGKFEIKNLPAGKLEFQIWHEKAGLMAAKPEWKKGRFEVQVEDGADVDLKTIEVSAELFQ